MSNLIPRAGKYLLPPLFLLTFTLISQSQTTAVLSSNAPLCAGAPALALFETGGFAVSWNWNGPNGFTSSVQNPLIQNPVPAAAGLYSVTISDVNGVTATASIQVAIHQPGALSCNDNVILSIDAQGRAIITPQTVLQGTYDYTFYTVEVFDLQGISQGDTLGCTHIGKNLIYKVRDICSGNICWGNLRVEDKMPPTLICKDLFYTCAIGDYSPAYMFNELGITGAYPVVSDNCGFYNLTYADEYLELDCAQPANSIAISSAWIRRFWRVVDASGNISECIQPVFLVRRHLWAVNPPADTIISCETPSVDPAYTGAPYITEYGQNFPVYPNEAYCETDAGYSDEVVNVCDGTRKIRRTWVVTEDCPDYADSSFVIFTQIIQVRDTTGPVFTCPADLTVSIDPFTCCATTPLPDIVIRDNCSRINSIDGIIQTFDIWTNDSTATYGITGTLTSVPNNNLWIPDTLGTYGLSPCLLQGPHTVTYRAVDDCAKSTTCSFSLVVEDRIPPVVACDTWTQVALGPEGFAEVFAESFDNGSYDHCCTTQFYARRMDTPCKGSADFATSVWFCCSDIGDTIMVAFRAYDCAGNFNECMVRVLVEDKIKPVCIPPKHLTVECAYFDPTLASYGFATATDNCCIDTILHSANFNQFDTVCNRGTIIRTFRAIDCAGNTSVCTQRIIVDYEQYYYLRMPDDRIVNNCDGTGDYGAPVIHFEDCELIGISYQDEKFTIVPEGCYRIDRHWKIINWCTYNPNGICVNIPNPDISQQRPFVLPGPIISPSGTLPPWAPTVILVNPTDPKPTDYSTFWQANVNCYEYKQMILIFDTKDPIIENCPHLPVQVCDKTANNSALWNAPGWWDSATASHDLCEAPTDLSLTAYDACTGSQIRYRYLLFLDMDNNGTMETVINSNTPPPPGMVYYNNAFNQNFSGGELRPFDSRPVSTNLKYNFSLQEVVVGNKLVATVQWKTAAQLPFPEQAGIAPELPYGRHKIKWLVEDGCSNESFCEYFIDVKDCKAPSVVCFHGLSINIESGGLAQLWASDFLQYTEDNCTPSPLIKLGVRKAGSGTGFPLDANANPVTGVTFDCSEIGTQAVELWGMDLAGNADFCSTYIVVKDNLSTCGASAQVSGAVKTESQQGVEAVTLEVAGSSSFASSFTYFDDTDATGTFLFSSIPLPCDYTLTPEKDDNPVNGVTTYDLVEISKHILGIKSLGSPYKMIAADANHSNSITSYDIVELRKLVLGIYPDFPNNTSWRFVDKDYEFPNPLNPFQHPFPENKTVSNMSGSHLQENFVAVKIGDINDSAISNFSAGNNDRSAATPAFFDLTASKNDLLAAGEIVTLKIQAPETLLGFQFTLNFNGLEVVDILPDENMRSDFFALFQERKALTVSCDVAGNVAFILRCKVQQAGYLHQMLSIGSNITIAEAYRTGDAAKMLPTLKFPSPGQFEVYPVQPNPFVDRTGISFFLPQAAEVTIKLSDAGGSILSVQKKEFPAGFNMFDVDLQQNTVSGMIYFSVKTAAGEGAGKMIRIR